MRGPNAVPAVKSRSLNFCHMKGCLSRITVTGSNTLGWVMAPVEIAGFLPVNPGKGSRSVGRENLKQRVLAIKNPPSDWGAGRAKGSYLGKVCAWRGVSHD